MDSREVSWSKCDQVPRHSHCVAFSLNYRIGVSEVPYYDMTALLNAMAAIDKKRFHQDSLCRLGDHLYKRNTSSSLE